MNANAEPIRIHYNVDHLAIQPGLLHCWGWICAEDGRLFELRLVCLLTDGRSIEEKLEHCTLRQDVGEYLGHVPHASESGFMASVAWEKAELSRATIVATTVSGVTREFLLVDHANNPQKKSDKHELVRVTCMLSLRALRLLRRGQFSLLWNKMRRYWSGKPNTVANPTAEIRECLTKAKSKGRALLVIDHDLGGGAPLYRQRLIEDHVVRGGVALLLTFHVPTLSYAAQVYGVDGSRRLKLSDLQPVLELAQEGLIGEIFFNNAVSFPKPELIPDWLSQMRARDMHLTVAVHDFYLLCPSHFLLDQTGKYCNLPDTRVCADCLPKNREGFVSFFPARNIGIWRQHWRGLIDAADEIRFFSRSTLELFSRIYTDVPAKKMTVMPHSMDYFPAKDLGIPLLGPIRIGVVGHIGRHKGAKIICGLAQAISETGADVRITIFGSIDEFVDRNVVHVTGNYRHDELPALIAGSGSNIMLLPSIYPETFSYVTHELIQLNMPIVCFNLGAQAETVLNYAQGRVIPLTEGKVLLGHIMGAYKALQVGSVNNGFQFES
jgi:glycosyltransferase involved in cell wall biosynthesis